MLPSCISSWSRRPWGWSFPSCPLTSASLNISLSDWLQTHPYFPFFPQNCALLVATPHFNSKRTIEAGMKGGSDAWGLSFILLSLLHIRPLWWDFWMLGGNTPTLRGVFLQSGKEFGSINEKGIERVRKLILSRGISTWTCPRHLLSSALVTTLWSHWLFGIHHLWSGNSFGWDAKKILN